MEFIIILSDLQLLAYMNYYLLYITVSHKIINK